MAITTNYGWGTPALSGANNPPADLAALASAIDVDLKALDTKVTAAWTSWTPVWYGPVALSIGNGTLDCRYRIVGKTCQAQYFLLRGSTTNVGAAAYVFDLPVAARRYQSVNGAGIIARGATYWPVSVVGVGTGAIGLVRTDDRSRVSTTSPGSWADGDWLAWAVEYEAY